MYSRPQWAQPLRQSQEKKGEEDVDLVMRQA